MSVVAAACDRASSVDVVDLIRHWALEDVAGLLGFVQAHWYMAPPAYCHTHAGYVCVYTGGWKQNEELIEALRGNAGFWSSCWELSNRGGYHEFQGTHAQKQEARRSLK